MVDCLLAGDTDTGMPSRKQKSGKKKPALALIAKTGSGGTGVRSSDPMYLALLHTFKSTTFDVREILFLISEYAAPFTGTLPVTHHAGCVLDGSLVSHFFSGFAAVVGLVTTLKARDGSGVWDGPTGLFLAVPAAGERGVEERLFFADSGTGQFHCVTKLTESEGKGVDVSVFAGTGGLGFTHGPALTSATFNEPRAIVADPSRRGQFYVADMTSIRRIDPNGVVSLLASSDKPGLHDPLFNSITGLLCNSSGSTLLVADEQNALIRIVDIRSGDVHSVGAGMHGSHYFSVRPRQLAFAPTEDDSESSVYITANLRILRWDIERELTGLTATGRQMKTIYNGSSSGVDFLSDPWGIHVCRNTNRGLLIVSCRMTHCLYSVDPHSAKVQRIAGKPNEVGMADGPAKSHARFTDLRALVVSDSERCAYVVDWESIRKVYLPAFLFVAGSAASTD